jgi:SagB-type dehydrogenase family enzyme
LHASKTRRRRAATATLSARLPGHVSLETRANGEIVARIEDYAENLGKFSAGAAGRAAGLRSGLALGSFERDGSDTDKEIHLLVRRLARRGLVEYRLARTPKGDDEIVIEPQVPAYWPRTPPLGSDDVLVLSRFAYLRRRANGMVLESPRAGALFRIGNPQVAAALASLSAPQQIKRFRRRADFPGVELLALLVDCQILFKVDAGGDKVLRAAEGDDDLVVWDFHDLLFHTRSTEGRHANPVGGLYAHLGVVPPPPAVRSPWPGEKLNLSRFSATDAEAASPAVRLLHDRRSTRDFDDARPITLAELARFLDRTARVRATWSSRLDLGDASEGEGPLLDYTVRPYPSGGGSYELELYLAVDKCEGLARGLYHYDAGDHALVPIGADTAELDALLRGAAFAMGVSAPPQIAITITARFGRTAWKYSSIAYSLILKDVGVLLQTFYLMATDMRLGGCAIGTVNIDLFAKMTGLELHAEGPVGQFALGRGAGANAPG